MNSALEESVDRVLGQAELSGVVQISRGHDVLCTRVSGLADRAHGIPNLLSTRFGIASATKGLTALTIMSLISDGSLELDTRVRTLLGDDLELIDAKVTVGHLLAHTSGIGDYLDETTTGDIGDYVMPVPVHNLSSTRDYIAVLSGHPAKFEAGDRFEYCNSGFVLLALIAELAGGASFYDLVAERVLSPAGMMATTFPRSDELTGSEAIGYVPAEGRWRSNHLHLPVRGSGDGGAYSTVGDFACFWPALFDGRIISLPLVEDMVRPRNYVSSESKWYGLGFWLQPEGPTVMLEGYDAGVSFRSAYNRRSEVLYTVISNTSAGAWPLVTLLDAFVAESGPA